MGQIAEAWLEEQHEVSPSLAEVTPTRGRLKMTWPSFTLSGVVSVVALVISVGAFVYTMKTYAVTHRPYVGIIEQNNQLVGNPPTGMLWVFKLKNVGSVPTWVKVEENLATFKTDGRSTTLPLIGEPGGGIFLMPGQSADLSGSFSDASGFATVGDVLSGRTLLEVNIRLSYDSSAVLWGKNRYYYVAKTRFRHSMPPPSFIMVSGDAN